MTTILDALVQEIAISLVANANAIHMDEISRATWSAEQDRLWALAAAHGVAAQVMRAICPSLRGES